MSMLCKCIAGGYVNFAICDFYNDNSFGQLCTMVVNSILNQDLTEMAQYKKVNKTMYLLIEEFFKKHLELMFLKMDFDLVKEIIQKILIPGIYLDSMELKMSSLTSLDLLNGFIFNHFKLPNKKHDNNTFHSSYA